MKRIILLLVYLAMVISPLLAQELLKVDTVIALPGVSKDVAFIKASEWIASKYNSANDVIQLSDKEAGVILCKGMFPHEYGKSGTYGNLWGNIHYTLITKFKDEKIRITVKDFTHETQLPGNIICVSLGPVNTGEHPKWGKKKRVRIYWENLQSSCRAYSHNIISGLQEFLTETDDNW